MYYANMFCYGMDMNYVGITGIRGCMGVVFVSPTQLYAVHIPPSVSRDRDLLGMISFAHMVTQQEATPAPAGSLYLFVNGTNRLEAEGDAGLMSDALGNPPTRVYRIMTNLGLGSGGAQADSAAIRVKRMPGHISLRFKHVPDNQWVPGGNANTGQYFHHPTYATPIIPNPQARAHGWNPLDNATCNITDI